MLADKPIDQFRFEPKLFGICDVLPGAPAARPDTRFGIDAEVAAAGDRSMWRSAENLDERRDRLAAAAFDDADLNALAGDGEGNGQRAATVGCDAVTVGREGVDVDDHFFRVGVR